MPHVEAECRAGELVETAFAKVNLALHVRKRRPDGYHALESLFVFAEAGDRLAGHVRPDGMISLRVEGPFAQMLDAGPDNLVMKAACALRFHVGKEDGAALVLTKNLPVASGIGGGSADAAAALRLLMRLWDVSIAPETLEQIALSLGSDVPACLSSVTQMVSGRGEVLQRQTIPGLAGMPMLLVNPGVGVSTARIFGGWDQVDRGALAASDLRQLVEAGRNDLEPPAMAVAPVIGEVLSGLRSCEGVAMARMSGSGATCFALFDTERDLVAAATSLREGHPQWWIAETRIRSA
ncbi:4-(cytidine 5'-diphospho)-2-C-methyl-D-erythritol kinase [Sphingobium chungbukense]|uniref:4-diphosphocytidyl-2-C-methyl-D-erythritol kinase n=1 Tax=Sphingobium chungbukense TaxID=56193 RepID=A0A0M3ASC3_9SPHN|nr:4-(cytidine 5'-diphospho)-2-C-methyl-D-erythritol kinase [Sphingobium chungbukense]KKW92740.1 4-diphosphocytidyl-2C-methyl-D-erythritol kinase [Sphingobium chungbukense]